MWFRLLALLLVVASSDVCGAPDRLPSVLVLHSFGLALPINAQYQTGIANGLQSGGEKFAEFDFESLDLSRIDDEAGEAKLIEILRIKYRAGSPDLVIATYTPALRFLLRHRDELFPQTPIVFCGADAAYVRSLRLPPNVTGVTSHRDFAGTLELMARLHPGLHRVTLVVGGGSLDRQWQQDAREALRPYDGRYEFRWLEGLPVPELTQAVRSLPEDSAVLYLVQFTDRTGRPNVPRLVVQDVAKASNVPVYGLWDTLNGTGIVGGQLISAEKDGKIAGTIGRRILQGESTSAIPIVDVANDVVVDAHQLRRWNISEGRLPPDTRVLNRDPSLWDQYRNEFLVGFAVIALQSVLIGALAVNRRKLRQAGDGLKHEYDERLKAESVSRKLQARVGAADKHAALGALASGIAHEINQPLIAIKNYVEAAKRYISPDAPRGEKLSELLAEIEGESGRAAAIIAKVRKLLGSGRVEAVAADLPPLLNEAIASMRSGFDAHNCHLVYRVAGPVAKVRVDPLDIQLVVVNLLRNALEAMEKQWSGPEKAVMVDVRPSGDDFVEVSVADLGPGIPEEAADEIFEPLWTTKASGMGVGLATCRTIVEAHGGRIWYEPNPAGGAIFHFTLPTAEKETYKYG